MNNYIDLEKVTNSIETISTMENVVNYVNLAENFEEMEKYFRKINFEHANCLKYKDSLDLIYDEIEEVRRKINELIDALNRTVNSYNNTELITRKDLKTLANIYKFTPASEELQKQLYEYTKDQKKVYAASIVQIGKNKNAYANNINGTIDTVPIGLAIGVTGVVGSLAAVAINEKNIKEKTKHHKKKNNDFKVQVYKGDTDIPKELDVYDEYFHQPNKDEIIPYEASRMERNADMYYGNQLNDIIPKQDNLIIDDEDEDDGFDDFY